MPVRHRRKLWHWQDWSLTAKMLSLVLIPVLVLAALGAVQIRTETARSASYRSMDRIVQATDDLGTVLYAVQQERTAAVAFFAAGSDGDASTLSTHQDQLQQARDRLADDMSQVSGLPAGRLTRYAAARSALDRLPGIRQQVSGHAINAQQTVGSYTAVTSALLAFEQSLVSGIGDNDLAPTMQSLHLIRAAQEYVFYQQAIILGGIARGSLPTSDAAEVQLSDARLTLALDTFRATATPAQIAQYQQQLQGAPVDARNSMKARALTDLTAPPGTTTTTPPLTTEQWNQVSLQTSDRMGTVVGDLSDSLHATAARLKHRADERTWIIGGVALLALLLALALALLCARSLRRTLGVVRRSARDIADHQLPDAMIKLRVGDEIETTPVSVPVRSSDEVGQLARAVEDMHGRALHLAVDQVNIRGSYNEVFVNLSRRSESLVRRQLSLIEQMEREEEDPEALGTLFQLDHLVTRMRRNNENLMVLSGSDVSRRFNRPIPLTDVVRAAVSEIEQYQRVALQSPANKAVVGYAASDLVRLVAELLDNATTFSAPETMVTVATYDSRDGGMSIDIRDRGVGMSEEAVDAANAAMEKPGLVAVSTSRQMGLFVVGKLAAKHNVRVRMHSGEDIRGLRVTVILPPNLLTDLPEQAQVPSSHAQSMRPIAHARPIRVIKAAESEAPAPPSKPEPAPPAAERVAATAAEVTGPGIAGSELSGSEVSGSELPGSELSGPAESESADDEKTPIFDRMLSVWFRDPKSESKTSANGKAPTPSSEDWKSDADTGFTAAGRATGTAPKEFTSSGLPKRRPGARILPGSVEPKGPATNGVAANGSAPGRATGPARHTAVPERHADVVRGRLATYQRGLQRGRDTVDEDVPATNGKPVNGAPTRTNGVAHPEPEPVKTAAGLPRRTPGASKVPTAPAAMAAPARHSAEQVRGQLTNYRAGVSKGRDQITEPEVSRAPAHVAAPQSGPQEKE